MSNERRVVVRNAQMGYNYARNIIHRKSLGSGGGNGFLWHVAEER